MDDPDQQFVQALTAWQNPLFGYVVTLLGNPHDARDVIQQTNLVLWRRRDTFAPGTDFGAWARRCAYFQTLAFLRDRKRGPTVLGEELLALIASEEEEDAAEDYERTLALRDCLGQLTERRRSLLKRRYHDGISVRKLAADEGKNESAMKMVLMRIREALQLCISMKLGETAP